MSFDHFSSVSTPTWNYPPKRTMDNPKPNRRSAVSGILLELVTFLNPWLALANAHMVDYFVRDHWNALLPPELRSALDSFEDLGENYDQGSPSISLNALLIECENLEISNFSPNSVGNPLAVVRNFVSSIYRHTLPYLLKHHRGSLGGRISITSSRDVEDTRAKIFVGRNVGEAEEGLGRDSGKRKPYRMNNTFMSTKKEHEIARMAAFVAEMADSRDIDVIVDVGSGKGYLGQELASFRRPRRRKNVSGSDENAMDNWFRVIGIEGNEETSHGATDRRERMSRKGRSLLSGDCFKRECKLEDSAKDGGSYVAVAEIISDATHLSQVTKRTLTSTFFPDLGVDTSSRPSPFVLCGLHACGGLTSFILRCFADLPPAEIAGVCVVGCCYQRIREWCDGDCACGSNSVDEDDTNDNGCDRAKIEQKPDFPLSSCLSNFSVAREETTSMVLNRSCDRSTFALGRNARMLGNQPPARSAALDRPPDDSLFLRAVLEVILRRHFCVGAHFDARVGKIKKCHGDYLTKALTKLGFLVDDDDAVDKMAERSTSNVEDCEFNEGDVNGNADVISGKAENVEASEGVTFCTWKPDSPRKRRRIGKNHLRGYIAEFAPQKRRLFAFFQTRTLLAPVIEAVVVLDRLMFLLETDNVVDAAVLEMFDPVQSPRCYAVAGTKR